MQRNVARGAAIALALVGLLAGAPGEAQVTTGTIVGTVKDPQGAAVPGRHRDHHRGEQGDVVGTYTTDADGSFHGALPDPRHLRGGGRARRLPQVHRTAASCCRSTSARASTRPSRWAASPRPPR